LTNRKKYAIIMKMFNLKQLTKENVMEMTNVMNSKISVPGKVSDVVANEKAKKHGICRGYFYKNGDDKLFKIHDNDGSTSTYTSDEYLIMPVIENKCKVRWTMKPTTANAKAGYFEINDNGNTEAVLISAMVLIKATDEIKNVSILLNGNDIYIAKFFARQFDEMKTNIMNEYDPATAQGIVDRLHTFFGFSVSFVKKGTYINIDKVIGGFLDLDKYDSYMEQSNNAPFSIEDTFNIRRENK